MEACLFSYKIIIKNDLHNDFSSSSSFFLAKQSSRSRRLLKEKFRNTAVFAIFMLRDRGTQREILAKYLKYHFQLS